MHVDNYRVLRFLDSKNAELGSRIAYDLDKIKYYINISKDEIVAIIEDLVENGYLDFCRLDQSNSSWYGYNNTMIVVHNIKGRRYLIEEEKRIEDDYDEKGRQLNEEKESQSV